MQPILKDLERRTATDLVFEKLHDDIVSLGLPPGSKISESEVAERFGVSRQPVRDAFNRLSNLDLVLIRPQKATIVRGFSIESISRARFVRLAVEIEVIRSACEIWDKEATQKLTKILHQQQNALDSGERELFHVLDLDFHAMIFDLSNHSLAIGIIEECRLKTDRLCTLSFGREREMESVIEDHEKLIHALDSRDTDTATQIIRVHLNRLDAVVDELKVAHANYFE